MHPPFSGRLQLLAITRIGGLSEDPASIPQFFSRVCRDVEDSMLVTGSVSEEYVYDCNDMLHRMVASKNNEGLLFPRQKRLQIKDLQFDPILLAHVLQSRQDHLVQQVAPLENVEIAYLEGTVRSEKPDGPVLLGCAQHRTVEQ